MGFDEQRIPKLREPMRDDGPADHGGARARTCVVAEVDSAGASTARELGSTSSRAERTSSRRTRAGADTSRGSRS